MNFRVVLEWGREGPWEKRKSGDARRGGVGGGGAWCQEGGCRALYTLWAVFVAVNTRVGRICAV